MRLVAWLLLPLLALLLLAAHLFHNGAHALAAIPLALIVLLGVRRGWAGRLVQVVLFVATIEWALTAVGLARMRAGHGEPYLRLLVILGAVAVFTALAGLAFQNSYMRAWFRLGRAAGAPPAAKSD